MKKMDWNDPDPEKIEKVRVRKAGPHHTFSCTRRIECDFEDERDATHYVMFEFKDEEYLYRERPYFYSCEECIPDVYWELNDTN